ncbi:recombination regulator RecX [Lactococcus hircilactis]|uniref:Regulatory protein RecX n=1 Tax=Lactococcus hircilactis TaxID=1494462 RepID=A0A7X1Z8H4_9LACT|nr:recombination regulator RecX [Lactococcus hircilactis]MQW39776.1 recombination regulator RecX [Lactococcus hircilactis]
MIKITEIKKLKRLYKISLDGADLDKIYVCEDTIVHFFLTKDKILTSEELSALTAYDSFAQGKALAIYYISFKARTKKETRRYLLAHEIDENQIDAVLSALTENGLLNDYAYAEQFVHAKVTMGSFGPFQIKQKLMEKGIPREMIDEVLNEFFDEAIQIEVATKLAQKWVRAKAGQFTRHQLQQKVLQQMMSKGFSYAIAQISMDSLELSSDEENERELLNAALDKAYQKYARNYDGYDLKNRVTQALARKGFDYQSISSALRDYRF